MQQHCRDQEQSLFRHHFLLPTCAWHHLQRDGPAQFLGSTVSRWLMETLIRWPDTATLLLFSLFTSLCVFLSHRFLPGAAPHTLRCVSYHSSDTKMHNSLLLFFFVNRTNYCSANPDCCCHGNCLSGVMAPLELKWLRARENESKLGEDCKGDTHTHTHRQTHTHTHAAHCVPTYFMFHLVSWRVLLAVYLDSKWSDHGAAPRQCQRMNLMWVSGDKCSFSTEPGAKRSQSRDLLRRHLSTALNGCVGFKEGSGKYRGQHMSNNTYRQRKVGP